MGGEFDFHSRLQLGPVGGVKKFGFETAELLLGRADDIASLAFPEKVEVVLADHTPIHDPNAFGLPVFAFHQFHHVLDGGDIGGVAGEDFVADGQRSGVQTRPMLTCLQSDR